MPRNRGSNNWRTTPHAYATSRSDPRALATAKLRLCAASRARSSRLVLPIPAAPLTTTARPRPADTSSSASTMTCNSRSRSSSRPDTLSSLWPPKRACENRRRAVTRCTPTLGYRLRARNSSTPNRMTLAPSPGKQRQRMSRRMLLDETSSTAGGCGGGAVCRRRRLLALLHERGHPGGGLGSGVSAAAGSGFRAAQRGISFRGAGSRVLDPGTWGGIGCRPCSVERC